MCTNKRTDKMLSEFAKLLNKLLKQLRENTAGHECPCNSVGLVDCNVIIYKIIYNYTDENFQILSLGTEISVIPRRIRIIVNKILI